MEINEVAQSLVQQLKDSVIELKNAKGAFGILKAVPAVVRKAEEAGKNLGLAGLDKRTLALAIVGLLLPALPWYLPKPLILYAAGKLIDAAVAGFNRQFGKVWP